MCQALEGSLVGDSANWTMGPRKYEEDIRYVLFTGWVYICLSHSPMFYRDWWQGVWLQQVKPRPHFTIQYNTMFSILGFV